MEYNSIVSADDAMRGDVSEYLPGISEIFRKHGVEKKYGIWRVHRHFEVGDDEIMLRDGDVQRAMRTKDLSPDGFYPYTCIVRDGELVPLEFSTAKVETPNSGFVEDLDMYLSRQGISERVGISLSYNEPEHEINYKDGTSVYFPGTRNGPNMRTMGWCASDDLTPGQRTCEESCSGSNGNGQPVHKCV
ncbi:hypothetical protein GGI11_004764 [Coemansia sp. RSA 2049]|nr:hypothetical protein GGI11_004764 [Coemansia sp. RSA 2049]